MKIILSILCLLSFQSSFAQRDSSFFLLRTYRGDINSVALDRMDNLYVVSSTGQVKKFNPNGDSVSVFNGVRNYGKLQAIDVTNPLKPLLFYKDFSTVVILDRLLSSRGSLDLRKYAVLQPTAVTLSYDNNIWVFDQFDNKLKKLDESGNLLLQTTDLRQLFGETLSPQKIINDDGLVYLADSARGVFVFDNYGAFKRKIGLKNWQSIDIWNAQVIRLHQDGIVVYNPVTFTEQFQKFPPSFTPYTHSFTHHNKIVSFSGDSLRIYRFGN